MKLPESADRCPRPALSCGAKLPLQILLHYAADGVMANNVNVFDRGSKISQGLPHSIAVGNNPL
jgi:hypothetical protein